MALLSLERPALPELARKVELLAALTERRDRRPTRPDIGHEERLDESASSCLDA